MERNKEIKIDGLLCWKEIEYIERDKVMEKYQERETFQRNRGRHIEKQINIKR
jgi:hypothetical protein